MGLPRGRVPAEHIGTLQKSQRNERKRREATSEPDRSPLLGADPPADLKPSAAKKLWTQAVTDAANAGRPLTRQDSDCLLHYCVLAAQFRDLSTIEDQTPEQTRTMLKLIAAITPLADRLLLSPMMRRRVGIVAAPSKTDRNEDAFDEFVARKPRIAPAPPANLYGDYLRWKSEQES